MRNRILVVAACAVVLVVAAAGCGGGSSSSNAGSSSATSSSPGSNTSEAQAPAGEPIKVGMLCSCSGGQADALGKSGEVAEAWAQTVNAAGGINGYPVELFTEDDGGDPAKAQQAVKKLIEEDGVIAIVGTTSSPAESWAKYADSKGVPVVGGNPFLTPMSTDPNFFPVGSSVPVEQVGMTRLVKEHGKKKLGVLFCAETPICAQLGGLAQAAASLVGGVEVQTGKVGVSEPNFTAQCLALKEGGVEAVAVAQSAPTVARVQESCVQQGFTPLPLNYASGSSPLWLNDPNLNGMLMVASEAPYQDESIPQVQQFDEALDKYAPGLRESDQFAYSGSWDTWLGGRLFEAAAKAGNVSPTSTGADVTAGLYKLKNETLDGGTVPLNYTKGQPTFLPCYFVMGIEDGKYTSPEGTEPQCLTTEEQTKLGELLAG